MKFKEWFLNNEATTGRTNARPSQTFAANRGQLWGPSAQFGQPDSMHPIEKGIGGVVTGIGSSIAKSLRRDISPQPSMLGLKIEKEPLIQTVVLPLQFSEDVNMSPNSYQKPRTLMYKVMPFFDYNKINFTGQNEQGKYSFPDLSNNNQANISVNFTKGLIFNLLRIKLKSQSKKFNLEEPEVLLEDRKDVGNISYLRVAVSYKPRELPKDLEDKLSAQPAYQGDDDSLEDIIRNRMNNQNGQQPPPAAGTSNVT